MDRRRAAGALLALAACIASSAAAPTFSNQTALDLYDATTEGCYYNFQHYGEGDRIMTNEPCLNCTCHNRMLMCYLRVCPFTKPIGQDCTVEKRADQCCPIVTCPDVPVDLLTSTSTSSPAEYGGTGVGKLDKYGCSIHGKYFSEGSKVPPTPNKPCEHCYCIRNMTTCVMQECTLHVDGCTPIYHKDVCCPVRYSCDHPEDELLGLDDMSTTVRPTPGFLLTTTTVSPVTQVTQDCVHNDQIFTDGTSIKTEKACEHCYCMKGDIVCVVQECGTPMENEGKNCTSQPPREGQCCPDTYICEGDELTTELPFDLSTQSPQEELTTLSPPRRTEVEGSGYRIEPDEPLHTDIPAVEPDVEGSGDEFVTMQPLDGSEKYTPGIMDDTFASTEDQGLGTTKSTIEEEKITIEPDSELNTVPSGVSESPIPKLTTLAEETKTSDEQEKPTTQYEYSTTLLDNLRTTKESVLHTTESSFRKEDELHVPTDISTQKIQDKYTTLEPPTKETYEEKEEVVPTIEDDTKITKPSSVSDDIQTMTTALPASTSSDISTPVKESSQPSEHTVSELQTTTEIPEKTDTTAINAYENEIEDHSMPQGAGRIPGEGDCLQAGITYRNESSVPSTNNCQTDCKCISSIVKCDPIICSPPPEYMSNCVPTYDSSESCCPTYVCDESKETLPPQPHSQMSETESSTSTPTIECSDDQCEAQDNKTPTVPVCTSQDCLTKPIETAQPSDCETENCKGLEQIPIQPDMQTDCGPTGCDGKIETTHHEPPPVPPESCTEAECKQEVGIKPCEGENCKTDPTKACQNEEDCKNIQDIPKTDTCEGDGCKEIPVDCGATGCDVSPPIQQAPEICNNEECQKPEEIAPVCTDDSCRRKDTQDVEGKLPTECTDPNCIQEKPESPELSVPEAVSTTSEKMPDISVTPELQNEVTLSPETTLDQESSMQTELSHEVGTQATQTSMDSFATESSTSMPKLSEMTTIIPELTKDEISSEPETVEIKQTSELPTTVLHDITTELSDPKIMVSQPYEKITTTPQPISAEAHTLTEHETLEDITETSVTLTSEDHEEESSMGTQVGDFVTKIPEIFTSQQYDHSTQAQVEITTKQEDAKLPVDTEKQLTTQSITKEETDLEQQTDQEVITKLPVLASETTAIITEKEPIPSTPPSEATEKSKLPEFTEIYTDSSVEYPSVTQPASDIEEKISTEHPSILEDKTEAVTETSDMIHASESTAPSKFDEIITTISPEITEFSYEPQTTSSLTESELTKPQEVDTKKPDIYTPETEPSATISPELYSTDQVLEQSTTMKEIELTDTSREPEEKEHFTTMAPSISREPELETKTPALVPDLEEVPMRTEAPLSPDDVSKEKLPQQFGDIEQPEIDTEEPSIQEEPGVTEHEEVSPESPVESPVEEIPIYIPVYTPTIEDKHEQPDKETPINEVSPETMPEQISSTTQKLEITTLQPDVVTQTHVTEKDITHTEFDKSDEITQSPYSKVDSDITEIYTEHEPAITSTRAEPHEIVTESNLIVTEEEDIVKTTETPESYVKDIEEKIPPTIPKVTDVDTTEKQAPIDKIQTELPVIVIPETSATILPDQEEDLSTKTQKPEIEIEEAVTKISDQTTKQYDHSETLPDMIELVEHHPISDISSLRPTSDEVATVSDKKPSTMYTDMQEIDKEHKFDDTFTTLKPMISETEYKPTPEEIEIKTISPEESTSVQSTTHGYEHTSDGEVTTKQPDDAEIEHAVTADEKMTTEQPKVPDIEQTTMHDKEILPEKDVSDIEPEGIPAQESSTEKSETTIGEQTVILEEKPQTEKPEIPIVEQDITRLEEFVTEKETTTKSESITEEPETVETEHTIKPDKEIHVEPSEMPGMDIEQEITTETPAADTAFDDSSKEPEESTSRDEMTSEKPSEDGQEVIPHEEYTTKGSEIPVTEYVVPGQETVTEREIEEESATVKAPSTEEIIDTEHKVTPEKETGASETESPTTETKITSSQESVTNIPEGIEHELDRDLTTSTEKPESSISEQEMKPVEEPSITEQDTMLTDGEVKPDDKFSTIVPDISDIEPEETPDKEPAATPETQDFDQKPDMESSTEQHEISDIEKEEKPGIKPATEKTDKPETDHEVTPGIKHPEPATELTQSPETVTTVPESTTPEFEAIPDEATEKTEISVGHEGIPEQGSMTKEPESTLDDHDVLSGQELITKEPISPEIGHEETPHKEATEQPETTESLPEILPEQESATLKPEIPISDQKIALDQEFTTREPETPKLEQEMKPEKESSTEHAETTEKEEEMFIESSEKPGIEQESPVEQSQIPEIEPQHSTEPSEVAETKPQFTERPELPEIEPQYSTEPSEVAETKPQSAERPELPEIEPQHSTESSEVTETKPQSTERPELPEIEPQYSTEPSEIPEVEPQASTEPSEVFEVEPQSSTEHPEMPEIGPQTATEQAEEPNIPQSSTERLKEPEIEPQFTTERLDISEIEPQYSTHPSEIPETEPQFSSEPSETPEIEPQRSTQRPEVPEIELQPSSEAPESEIDKEVSTEEIEPVHEMTPILESTKPTEESEVENELIPDKETSTEQSEIPKIEHETMPSTERSDTAESEVKPIEGSTERSESTESESIEPEIAVTEHDVIDLETSTRLPETSEVEHEIKPVIAFTTERSEIPETTDKVTSILPSEDDHTKSKPIEEDILAKTTTERVYETTIAVDKEVPEKITSPPEVQEGTVNKEEDSSVSSTTSRYPLKEEPTTSVSMELEKTTSLETEIPMQTERETEKPTESKDTTAPEEEFLTVTTKATTPKTEEVISTQSPSFDKFTKPHDRPDSELLPSSVAPEIPKPGFNEVQATDEIPSPEDDGHFAPSATGGYGGQETDYEDENQPFGPGTCRYGGKVYVSAQQIPRDDPCDFCFCFRSDIICLQQSCPPPIHGCHEEPIQGFCCPRYECPVSMASTLNITTTTTTTTTTLPPHFNLNAYQGAAQRRGCQIKGHTYKVGEVVRASSGPCLHCTCGGDGQMKCDPKACTPEPMLRQMIAAAVSAKRRR